MQRPSESRPASGPRNATSPLGWEPVTVPLMPVGMTLTMWRKTPLRAEWLREMLDQPTGREFLAALHAHCPVPGLEGQEKTALQGAETAGYVKCLRTVMALAQVVKPTTEVEADYGGTSGGGPGESGTDNAG